MSGLVGFLSFPVIAVAACLLARMWPNRMRRASRGLALVNGLALLFIMATGWIYRAGPAAQVHRWLPHGLLIADWSAIPLAIGETVARPRGRLLTTAARAAGLLSLLGVVFLGSITGYLGPSQVQVDAMSLLRFQVLHYYVFPGMALGLILWWYHDKAAEDMPQDVATHH